MYNKKGQFYIVAAIIIVMILFSMASISTYAIVKQEPRTIFDLGSDLNRESYKVIEYGIYNEENLTQLIDNFTSSDIAKYFLKKTDNANIVFVYGDKDNLQSLRYIKENTGTIIVGGAGWNALGQYSEKSEPMIIRDDEGDEFVEVEIAGNKHFFDLKENEMFYFVIAQEIEEEKLVERNEKPSEKKRPGGSERKSKKSEKVKEEDDEDDEDEDEGGDTGDDEDEDDTQDDEDEGGSEENID